MPPKKKARGLRSGAKRTGRMRPKRAVGEDRLSKLSELAEALEIMLPELSARMAALEHLLIEKGICAREDLIRAREFVDLRRGGAAAG